MVIGGISSGQNDWVSCRSVRASECASGGVRKRKQQAGDEHCRPLLWEERSPASLPLPFSLSNWLTCSLPPSRSPSLLSRGSSLGALSLALPSISLALSLGEQFTGDASGGRTDEPLVSNWN